METIVGLKELRKNVSRYAEKAKRGESFIVMRRSKALFRITPVDHEEMWETVIDFTKIKKGGVPIKDLLSRL